VCEAQICDMRQIRSNMSALPYSYRRQTIHFTPQTYLGWKFFL